MQAKQVTGPVAYHAEGPVWSSAWGGLRWVDMLAGDILSLAPSGRVQRQHVAEVAAALRPRRDGGAVIGVERGFALQDADGTITRLADAWTDEGVRMNDGGCDPDGRFYCGSMAYDQRDAAGALFRLDPDRSVHRVLDGVTISNGLDWSPDGALAYYVDSPTGRVDVFDYDAITGLTDRRVFVAMEDGDGSPDGLTVDADGGVWVAFYGGSAVRRYTEHGQLDAVIELPTPKVTACTFGGPELAHLYITTSREDMEPGVDPVAGSLFRAEPGVRGMPTRPFDG